MTGSRHPEASGERVSGSLVVAERSRELARERASVEAIQGRLIADERSVLSDLSALHDERGELERALALARERVASLDAAITAEEAEGAAKAQELACARHMLQRDRELTRQIEEEILEYRRQISSAQERLVDLVKNVMRIQHKLWRAATDEPGQRPQTRG